LIDELSIQPLVHHIIDIARSDLTVLRAILVDELILHHLQLSDAAVVSSPDQGTYCLVQLLMMIVMMMMMLMMMMVVMIILLMMIII
jgi:hypothetical protein